MAGRDLEAHLMMFLQSRAKNKRRKNRILLTNSKCPPKGR